MSLYQDSRYAVQADTQDLYARELRAFAAPGTWWSAAQRAAVVAKARKARAEAGVQEAIADNGTALDTDLPPTRTRPETAADEGAFAPTVPAGKRGGDSGRALYGGDMAPNIMRSLSLVPAEARALIEALTAGGFSMVDRAANSMGISIEPMALNPSEAFRAALSLNDFGSARNSLQ